MANSVKICEKVRKTVEFFSLDQPLNNDIILSFVFSFRVPKTINFSEQAEQKFQKRLLKDKSRKAKANSVTLLKIVDESTFRFILFFY